jgi:hypothetical protein
MHPNVRRPRRPRRPAALGRVAAALAAAVLAASAAAAQGADGQHTGPTVSLRLGAAFSKEFGGRGVLAGVQVRGNGSTYALAGLDVLMTREGRYDPDRVYPPAGSRIYGVPLSPPRVRLGAGQRARLGGATLAAEAFVAQQGVLDRFAPVAGGGLAVGGDRWAVTVEGAAHRAVVYELGTSPGPSLPPPDSLVGHAWVPSLEVGARWDVGSLGRSSVPRGTRPRTDRLERPVLGALAGGTVGAAAGFAVGLVAAAGCHGDTSCLGPAALGVVIGAGVGVPVGVHVAEGRKGNLLLGTAASLALTAAGFQAVRYTGHSGRPGNAVATMVPIAQIVVCTLIERRTAR